jgi:hypothetical protein
MNNAVVREQQHLLASRRERFNIKKTKMNEAKVKEKNRERERERERE